MKGSLDKHVEDFTDLFEICQTPTNEAYAFFFMSVSQYLKGKLAEEFPESTPLNMRAVYKCARKHEIAAKWASGNNDRVRSTEHYVHFDRKESKKGSKFPKYNNDKPRAESDVSHDAETWGHA